MGILKNIGQKAKGAIKQAGGFVKETATDFKEKAQDAIDKVKDAGKFALLLPLMPLMKGVLKAKNITPFTDIESLSLQFYNEIVKKNDYDEVLMTDDGSNIMVAAEPPKKVYNVKDVDPVTIGIIVNAVITWVKNAQAKKAEGAQLTKAQEAAAKLAEAAEKEGKQIVVDEAKFQIGDFLVKNGTIILFAIGALLAAAFLFGGKKS